MTRVKPDYPAPVFRSLSEADQALARMADLKRKIETVESIMNDHIDRIKQRAIEESAPARAELAALERALLNYAGDHKPELFARRKSLELTYGTIGFRLSSKLKLLGRTTWAGVLRNLGENGLFDLIRRKEEPDKEAMKSLPPEHLAELGCKVVAEEVFFYELDQRELEGGGK